MPKIDYVILGLGNPDKKYARTRHNIGWMAVEAFIEKYKGKISKKSQIANYSIINILDKNILLAMPLTYMNLSGIAAKYFLTKYDLISKQLLIIVDEYNFSLGKIHIKSSGSDGGHNGVFSIIEQLGTNEFFRLRCGIGKDFVHGELINYVLSEFSEQELHTVNAMILHAIMAIETFVSNDSGKAMSLINSAMSVP